MSKELAQTVRSKKIAALVAILAAFAVFATIGSQWDAKASSAVTESMYATPGDFAFSMPAVPQAILGSDPAPITSTLAATASDEPSVSLSTIETSLGVEYAPYSIVLGASTLDTIHGAGNPPLVASAVVIDHNIQFGSTTDTALVNTADTSGSLPTVSVSASTDAILITWVHPSASATDTGRTLSPVSSQVLSGSNSDSGVFIFALVLSVLFAVFVCGQLVCTASFASGNPSSTKRRQGRDSQRSPIPTHRFTSVFSVARAFNYMVRHGEDGDTNNAQVGDATAQASLGTDGADSAEPFDKT